MPRKRKPPPQECDGGAWRWYALLGALEPARVGTTLHFTFGSIVMRDFVRNWMHFQRKAKLAPALVGCADASLLRELEAEGVAAVGVQPELDVWTYQTRHVEKRRKGEEVFDLVDHLDRSCRLLEN